MKTKGYTLLEAIITVSIISVIFTAGAPAIDKYNRDRARHVVFEDMETIFRSMAQEAADSETRIDIIFDYHKNLILFEKEGKIEEKFSLPKLYKYSNTSTERHFTENGNVSPMFSFFVKTDDGEDVLKLTFSSTDKYVQSVHIRKYVNDGGNWVEID